MSADGGPAFPTPDTHHPDGQIQYGANGMSLRDWFAGQALVGMLSGYVGNLNRTCTGIVNIDPRSISVAYDIADIMLRARERGQEGGGR